MSNMSSRIFVKGDHPFAAIKPWIFDHPTLSDGAVRAWIRFYYRAFTSVDDDLQMSYADMAPWLKVSESTARRLVKELIDAEALEIEQVVTSHGQQANVYYVIYENPTVEPVKNDAAKNDRGVKNEHPQACPKMDTPTFLIKEKELASDDAEYSFTHSDIFEAICVTFGVNMSRLTESQRKSAGKAARELRGANATPYEIQAVFELMLKELGERKFVTLANLVQKWGEYIDRIPGASVDTTPVASVKLPSAERYDEMVALAEAGEKWTDASGFEWPAKDHPMFHYPELAQNVTIGL